MAKGPVRRDGCMGRKREVVLEGAPVSLQHRDGQPLRERETRQFSPSHPGTSRCKYAHMHTSATTPTHLARDQVRLTRKSFHDSMLNYRTRIAGSDHLIYYHHLHHALIRSPSRGGETTASGNVITTNGQQQRKAGMEAEINSWVFHTVRSGRKLCRCHVESRTHGAINQSNSSGKMTSRSCSVDPESAVGAVALSDSQAAEGSSERSVMAEGVTQLPEYENVVSMWNPCSCDRRAIRPHRSRRDWKGRNFRGS